MFSRVFDSRFRTPLLDAPKDPIPAIVPLRVRCQCGALAFSVDVESTARPLHCHCGHCRRFHASAFAAFVQIDSIPAALADAAGGTGPMHFDSPCAGLESSLKRLRCGQCKSILGAQAEADGSSYLALGCVEDASIPPALALAWQTSFRPLVTDQGAAWWTAVPSSRQQRRHVSPRVLRGRCACGACAFEAPSGDEFQMQHCYCNLCRRLSGSVGETWVPVRPTGFKWTADAQLSLVRTTGHGQRHMCRACGSTLTIVYDSQPDCIWPVAGVLDDDSLPADLPNALCRSIHICCSMMQPWYRLPDDQLPRLKYAG